MLKKIEFRDLLLLLILVLLLTDIFLRLSPNKANADTFKLDDCITSDASQKPNAYLHVVSH